jgi:hypothetical protein
LYPQLAAEPLGMQPNLLLQKLPARSFTVETLLQFLPQQNGEEAGLVISGQKPVMLGLSFDGSKNRVVLRAEGGVKTLAETPAGSAVRFRLELQAGGRCSLAFAEGSTFVPAAQGIPVQKGVWIGAKIGLYSLKLLQASAAGHVDIDYFRFA